MVKIMITNGGPHPADKWADITTDTILDLIQIEADSDTPAAMAARTAKRNLRNVLFDIFNGHHDGVQRLERSGLAGVKTLKHATDHFARPLDVTPHMDVMDEVAAALAATPFAAHFAKTEVLGVIKQIVGQHTANAMHIERSWHRDRLAEKGA